MTPEQEATRALNSGTARSDLSADAQIAYDRLAEQQSRTQTSPSPDPVPGFGIMPRWASAVITAVSAPVGGPGLVLVLVPWLITHFQTGTPPWPLAARALGVALIAVGVVVNIATFVRFPVEGIGTPFPTNPPSSRKVMVGGPYRYVRNPMYVSYFVAVIGEALLLSRPALFIYLLVLAAFVAGFVRWWEEPTMTKRFGAEYEAYCKQVPRWWPRLPRLPRRTP
jgi:protein-S-isoprenylcysteine O-methyltransferase Ste14